MMKQELRKKALLLELGQKIYQGLSEEKITLDSKAGERNLQAEIERVTALIDYVRSKKNGLQSNAKGNDKAGRNRNC